MSAYGYEIVQTLIVDIEPDEHVKRSMNEINAGDISITFSIFNTIGRLKPSTLKIPYAIALDDFIE